MATGGAYGATLGTAQLSLATAVRELHCAGERTEAAGRFTVRRGRGPLVWLVAELLGLPAAGERVPVRLRIERFAGWEMWQRDFGGGRCLRTTHRVMSSGRVEERIGIVLLVLEVAAADGTLQIRQLSAAVRLGRLRVPLPTWLCPRTTASAATAPGGRVAVTVRVTLPGGGLLAAYAGVVEQAQR